MHRPARIRPPATANRLSKWRVTAAALLAASSSGVAEGPREAALATGRQVYNSRCYFCHGYSGDAETLTARFVVPPPRDFTEPASAGLGRERMIRSVTQGRPGTAMKGFSGILLPSEIEAVVDYVRHAFIDRGAANTRYHTSANGWPEHERYWPAFPFATGDIPVDAPEAELSAEQLVGKRLYLATCVSCHDHGRVLEPGEIWEPDAVSYPRLGFATGDFLAPPDAMSGATPFARHDVAPAIPYLNPAEQRGEDLYQANCAFCHAADGTARNWIGSFLEPAPRDFTGEQARATLTPERLRAAIRNGVSGTSMPAWRTVLDAEQIEAVIAYLGAAFLRPRNPGQ